MNGKKEYTGSDIAIIVPTKDRPEKVENLLISLLNQTVSCGKIIFVDGGESVIEVINKYKTVLPVEYYQCQPPGQIRQRNLGISKVGGKYKLIGFIDDDMLFQNDAFEKMIDCWNSVNDRTAGIGFNIVNAPYHRFSPLLGAFFMSSSLQGRVLKSGYCTSIQNIEKDIETQWLGGGYTIWKREIIEKNSQENLNTKWATGEDLRFSYPIGKENPLYVCSSAKVKHDHEYVAGDKKMEQFYGRKGSIGFFYFNSMHSELSMLACLWMLSGISLISLSYGILTLSSRKIRNAIGQANAVWICVLSLLKIKNIYHYIED